MIVEPLDPNEEEPASWLLDEVQVTRSVDGKTWSFPATFQPTPILLKEGDEAAETVLYVRLEVFTPLAAICTRGLLLLSTTAPWSWHGWLCEVSLRPCTFADSASSATACRGCGQRSGGRGGQQTAKSWLRDCCDNLSPFLRGHRFCGKMVLPARQGYSILA